MIAALFWSPTPEALYREVGGAKQLCSEFRFKLTIAPGYKREAGFISFDAQGRVTVKPGYVWDGASGPTIDTVDSICGSLLHDVCYELMRLGLLPLHVYKPVADRMFYDRLITDGMVPHRALVWYTAVCQFGHSSCLPENQPKIKRAPVPFDEDKPKIISPVPGYYVPA